ncbi:glycosyltransferase [Flavobacterium sp. NRK F7]|uniref:glycosyltransferase n=1 Tax=Flavobacterium sp. NRK F7 TaxID=2954930 RepID=UPI0020910F38|nr:glycosyltransferase [Flavobacterium sp. NRK F7]MCO6163193.1 glycosyltransferase family 4 protein [Flavobacterium sp. NRK F7]
MISFKHLFSKKIDFDLNSLINGERYDASKKTIVFISNAIPTYDKDSGSNRLKEIILAYVQLGYNCFLTFTSSENDNNYIEFFKNEEVILFSELKNKQTTLSFLKAIPKVDFIWFYGPNTLKRHFQYVHKTIPEATTLYDMVDIHFLRYKRAIELNPKRISLKKRYKKYFHIETVVAKKVALVITISEQEKEFMSTYIAPHKMMTISNIHYPKISLHKTLPFEERKNILFIGSTHTPNIDALYFLFEKIMPKVWEKLPQIAVDVIGNLNTEINDIVHPNFVFHGYIPDIETYFTSSKFMVVPLRYGAGVKGKIGQSFEYYLPLITTAIGAEGMFLEHEKNALIASSEEDFANEIIRLYNDKNLWLQLQSHSEESLAPFSRTTLQKTLLSIDQL